MIPTSLFLVVYSLWSVPTGKLCALADLLILGLLGIGLFIFAGVDGEALLFLVVFSLLIAHKVVQIVRKWRDFESIDWRNNILRAFVLFIGLAMLEHRFWAGSLDEQEIASAVEINLPFKGGLYLVRGAGQSHTLNHHLVSRSQRHAVDIVRLGALGAWRTFNPASNEDYLIFGEELVAPCAGVVMGADDQFQDFYTPEGEDRESVEANHVSVLCKDHTYIYMSHLMQNSLVVESGDPIKAGQKLAQVGNSGNSTEPHLHIEVYRKDDLGEPRMVPIVLNGVPAVTGNLTWSRF